MIIRLKDRTEITVTKKQAEKIKQAINDGVVGIEVGEKWFRSDYVASILPGGDAMLVQKMMNYENKGQEVPIAQITEDSERIKDWA